jgi:hypothetical protein
VAGGGAVYAAVCDGAAYRLWRSADGADWREVKLPEAVPAGPDHRLLVAADGNRVLVVTDRRAWLT